MSNFSLDHVNDMYMDVLKEIGNIGAGNATTSLASMLNEQINMNVPKVELMEASKLGSAICPEDEIIVGIFLEVSNDISGSMMFLMKMDSAHYLVNRLMGKDLDNQEPFDEMDLSAMKESAGGTATPILNRSLWDKMYIPVPPLAEQNRIVQRIEELLPLVKGL
jgi:chemotaxis protein CheC